MHFDVIVAGGGTVGASIVRALRGLSVALVASHRPAAPTPSGPDVFDGRVYALSPGSVDFLRSIKAWDLIPKDRLTAVRAMNVFAMDHTPGQKAGIEFDAYRAGVAELAWIVEDDQLQYALWRALATQDGLEIFAPASCVSLGLGSRASLGLGDGRTLHADLVVGADGAESFVREAAGISVEREPYGQTAVVANFSCGSPHRNTAYQWFRDGSILALLPLPGNRVSMVWSVATEEAGRLLGLEANLLGREVTLASAETLGALEPIGTPQSFPLRRVAVKQMVLPHLALAGDAAHVIHPLAGQGLNLGLQDARSLGGCIALREPVRTPGDFRLLRRYERDRSEAILAMRTTVHGLQSLFGAGHPALRRARNLGLNLTDRLPVLKNILLRHALH